MVTDIIASYRRQPVWVQIWIFGILVPVNAAPILFWSQPYAPLVALLGIGGMLPNLYFLMADRGFSKAFALSHVVLWTPLVALLLWMLATGQVTGLFAVYCVVLLAIDVFSLAFDFPDSWRWLKGDRAIS